MSWVFEWDEHKAEANYRKHGITFEEAVTVFRDPISVTIFDADHSGMELRYVDLGRSWIGRVLVVTYTERSGRIRVINCRKASASECKTYEQRT